LSGRWSGLRAGDSVQQTRGGRGLCRGPKHHHGRASSLLSWRSPRGSVSIRSIAISCGQGETVCCDRGCHRPPAIPSLRASPNALAKLEHRSHDVEATFQQSGPFCKAERPPARPLMPVPCSLIGPTLPQWHCRPSPQGVRRRPHKPPWADASDSSGRSIVAWNW
jgi:hypothetical protein